VTIANSGLTGEGSIPPQSPREESKCSDPTATAQPVDNEECVDAVSLTVANSNPQRNNKNDPSSIKGKGDPSSKKKKNHVHSFRNSSSSSLQGIEKKQNIHSETGHTKPGLTHDQLIAAEEFFARHYVMHGDTIPAPSKANLSLSVCVDYLSPYSNEDYKIILHE